MENVEALTRRNGERVSMQFLSDTERGYVRKGGAVTVPNDEKLRSLSLALDIPLRDLHAALGREVEANLATSLVREKVAAYAPEQELEPETMAELSSELDDFARVRVETTIRQRQSSGRQLQVQG